VSHRGRARHGIHLPAFEGFCDARHDFAGPGNVSVRPHLKGRTRSFDGVREEQDFQEIDMIGTVARWGSNALLIGMAILTYALFVLAK
jgi:hypothetical protein